MDEKKRFLLRNKKEFKRKRFFKGLEHKISKFKENSHINIIRDGFCKGKKKTKAYFENYEIWQRQYQTLFRKYKEKKEYKKKSNKNREFLERWERVIKENEENNLKYTSQHTDHNLEFQKLFDQDEPYPVTFSKEPKSNTILKTANAMHIPSSLSQYNQFNIQNCHKNCIEALSRKDIHHLIMHIKQTNCDFGRNGVEAKMCEGDYMGYYSQNEKKIVICCNTTQGEHQIYKTLLHELVHLYDACRYGYGAIAKTTKKAWPALIKYYESLPDNEIDTIMDSQIQHKLANNVNYEDSDDEIDWINTREHVQSFLKMEKEQSDSNSLLDLLPTLEPPLPGLSLCLSVACSEIRAYHIENTCSELIQSYPNMTEEECIHDLAFLSAQNVCPDTAEHDINYVFSKCIQDLSPFQETEGDMVYDPFLVPKHLRY